MDNSANIRKCVWEVREIPRGVALPGVEKWHYARGASKTAVHMFGLFLKGQNDCEGVSWWLPPTKVSAVSVHPANWRGVLGLSRLAINPDVPKGAASFLLAKSRRLIAKDRWPVLLTYADTWRNHTGAIYRADNWTYLGLTRPTAIYTVDGRLTSMKTGPKTRTHDEMMALGASYEGRFAKHKFTYRRGA